MQTDRAKALVIEELASDDEGEKEDVQTGDAKSDHQNNIGSSKEPSVEHPDGKIKIIIGLYLLCASELLFLCINDCNCGLSLREGKQECEL